MCELFIFYLRGVSFARVIVSRNGNFVRYLLLLYGIVVRTTALFFDREKALNVSWLQFLFQRMES